MLLLCDGVTTSQTRRQYKRRSTYTEDKDQINEETTEKQEKQIGTTIKVEKKKTLPSWMRGYHDPSYNSHRTHKNPTNFDSNETIEKIALKKLMTLRSSLLIEDESQKYDQTSNIIHTTFTRQQTEDILDAVLIASKKDYKKISGACDFLMLLLQTQRKEEDQTWKKTKRKTYFSSPKISMDPMREQDDSSFGQSMHEKNIITRDTLIASAFHFCDCVTARESGIYSAIEKAVKSPSSAKLLLDEFNADLDSSQNIRHGGSENICYTPSSLLLPFSSDVWIQCDQSNGDESYIPYSKEKEFQNKSDDMYNSFISKDDDSSTDGVNSLRVSPNDFGIGIEEFGEIPTRIAMEAARIKRAEVMSDSVIGQKNSKFHMLENKQETEQTLRDLLLTVSADFRALAIRSVASLYRLQGIQQHQRTLIQNRYLRQLPPRKHVSKRINQYVNKSFALPLSKEEIKVAKEALSIYAPLAQRLGMQSLKSDLENLSFQILYPRQYSSALQLYYKNNSSLPKKLKLKQNDDGVYKMNKVANLVASKLEFIFRNDSILMNQLESVEVTSRVKEPFSLWKKILKLRFKESNINPNTDEASEILALPFESEEDKLQKPIKKMELSRRSKSQKLSLDFHEMESRSQSPFFSMMDVPDTIALRVIIHPKKIQEDDEEVIFARERLLCYYTQQLCTNLWPPADVSRVKDYIQYPKQNGYKSLHHTSGVFLYGEYWPFELQIRSQQMHTSAEFGIAAHWDYKLQAPTFKQETGENGSFPISISNLDFAQSSTGIDQIANLSPSESTLTRTSFTAIDAETVSITNTTAPSRFTPKFSQNNCMDSNRDHKKTMMNLELLNPTTYDSSVQASLTTSIQSTQASSSLNCSSYIEALTIARSDLVQKKIFLFVSPLSFHFDGKIIPLPSGSIVLDALKECELRYHTQIVQKLKDGNMRNLGISLNGRSTCLEESIANGDVLTVPL